MAGGMKGDLMKADRLKRGDLVQPDHVTALRFVGDREYGFRLPERLYLVLQTTVRNEKSFDPDGKKRTTRRVILALLDTSTSERGTITVNCRPGSKFKLLSRNESPRTTEPEPSTLGGEEP